MSHMRRIGKIRNFILVLSAACLVFTGYSAFSIWTFGSGDPLVKADAAVVLGAAVWNGEPSPVLRERVNHAIRLYEEGYVGTIIFTGGTGAGSSVAESEASQAYAVRAGVAAEDILIETESVITEENLALAHDIGTAHGLRTFAIVSDPLHMKRAMLMAKHAGMDAYPSPTQTSAYRTLRSKLPFLMRELFYYVGYVFSLPFR